MSKRKQSDEENMQVLTGFNGNALLKGADEKIEWNAEMLAEYRRCSNDPEYFIENYIKVVHMDRGLIPFELYPYQKRMIQTFRKENRIAVLCPRQSGKCVDEDTKVVIGKKPTGLKKFVYDLFFG